MSKVYLIVIGIITVLLVMLGVGLMASGTSRIVPASDASLDE